MRIAVHELLDDRLALHRMAGALEHTTSRQRAQHRLAVRSGIGEQPCDRALALIGVANEPLELSARPEVEPDFREALDELRPEAFLLATREVARKAERDPRWTPERQRPAYRLSALLPIDRDGIALGLPAPERASARVRQPRVEPMIARADRHSLRTGRPCQQGWARRYLNRETRDRISSLQRALSELKRDDSTESK